MQILVVDDEIHIRQLIGEVLRRNNYQVDKAGNGKEALELFRKRHHDVVITDIRMPEMDGLQLLNYLRSEPITRKIGFILITGQPEQQIIDQGVSLGMNNYLPKPFKPIELRKCIEAVVGRL